MVAVAATKAVSGGGRVDENTVLLHSSVIKITVLVHSTRHWLAVTPRRPPPSDQFQWILPTPAFLARDAALRMNPIGPHST